MGNIRQIIKRITRKAQDTKRNEHLQKGAQILRCTVGNHEFGLLAPEVVEVAMVPTIIEIPEALPIISGVVNIRGTIVPILDLYEKLNIRVRAEQNDSARLIVLPLGEEPVGFIADTIKPQLIEGLVEPVTEKEAEVLLEVVVIGEDHLPILRIEQLVDESERNALKEVCDQF